MSSVVDICNMALSRIGISQRIDSLTEASLQAEQCSLFYPHSLEFVLRADCDWGFATAFADLAEVASNPSREFSYAYAFPADCIRVRRIVCQNTEPVHWGYCDGYQGHPLPEITFRVVNGVSGRLITTGVSPAQVEYTARVSSPELFDPVFVSALAWKLAGNIAPALSRDAAIAGNCEAQYRDEILRAATVALNEGVTTYPRESIFITGRS